MRMAFFVFIHLLFFSGALVAQSNFTIDGDITISETTAEPTPGTIRYNASSNDFEGWNGEEWLSLTADNSKGMVYDVEGNAYHTIKIGNTTWMAENLRTRRYRNGDLVTLTGSNSTWRNADFGAYCWYQNDEQNDLVYGKLYNYHAVNSSRGLCPNGWTMPEYSDYTDLIETLGGSAIVGGRMKEVAYWNSQNIGATNASGFSALPGGFREYDGSFKEKGNYAFFWLMDRFLFLRNVLTSVQFQVLGLPQLGMSVRCIKE